MSLSENIDALALRIGQEVKSVRAMVDAIDVPAIWDTELLPSDPDTHFTPGLFYDSTYNIGGAGNTVLEVFTLPGVILQRFTGVDSGLVGTRRYWNGSWTPWEIMPTTSGVLSLIDENSGGQSLYITPEDFGAVGDGVADDTTAIQQCLDESAAIGRTAFLHGDYRITTSLLVSSGSALHLDHGAHVIKDFAEASGVERGLFRNVDFAVKANGVRIDGPGTIGAVDHTRTGQIFSLYGDDITLENFTIDTYAGGQAIIIAGDRNRIHGLTIMNSEVASGTGAVRMVGGSDFVCSNTHAESGDDVFQFAPVGSPESPLFSMNISRSSYVGCTGRSTTGRLMVVGNWAQPGVVGGMTCAISNVSFIGVHGKATERGIYVCNDDSTGNITNVTFTDCSVDMLGGEIGYQTITVRRDVAGYPTVGLVDNIRFSGFRIINPVGMNFSFQGQPTNLVFEGCAFPQPSDATEVYLANGGDVDGLTLRNCIFRGAGATQSLFFPSTAPAKRILIEGCTFYDLQQTAGGINLDGVEFARVLNNTFFSHPTLGSTARAIRVSSNSTKVYIEGNDFSGVTNIAKWTLLSSDHQTRDNAGLGFDADTYEDAINAGTLGVVVHGATAGTARPTGYATVMWIGSVEPANAIDGDLRVNTV